MKRLRASIAAMRAAVDLRTGLRCCAAIDAATLCAPQRATLR